MARKKKGAIPHIQAGRAAVGELREQRGRSPPNSPTPPGSLPPSTLPLPPAPLPKTLPFRELKRQHVQNLRSTIEASLIPLPDDQPDDFAPSLSQEDDYAEKMKNLRLIWDQIGYYKNHPNNNAANASEDQLEELLRAHHKLGPILKRYKLFINPSKMHGLLLQFPNREIGQEYCRAQGQKPIELRYKPKHGLVELDIPIDIHHNYDKEKGIQYGEAMRNSRVLQQGGSYGLAGGFGVGLKPSKDDKRAPPPEGPSVEKLLENFDDANNKGHVMNKITLGGMIVPFKERDPIYMTATFCGDICTWTKLDAIVQLRPQFTHIDALHEENKSASRQEQAVEEQEADKPDAQEPKAVNMAVKSAEKDEDDDMYGNMAQTAKLLAGIRDEPWQRLEWVDQDNDEAYEIYDETLVFQEPDGVPRLVSEMTEEQYLDAISCPRIDPMKEARKVLVGDEDSAISVEDSDQSELDLGDTEDEEDEEEENLPPGVIRPDDVSQQRRIEVMCRIICSKSSGSKKDGAMEAHLRKKTRGQADSRFLDTHNRFYSYFKWRLAENRAGRGYNPEDDLPKPPFAAKR